MEKGYRAVSTQIPENDDAVATDADGIAAIRRESTTGYPIFMSTQFGDWASL
jgi:hypothetical protein